MTFTIFERYDALVKLWEFVAPTIPTPPKETLIHWLSKYTDDQMIEKSVLRIPVRFRNRESIKPEDAYRLVSAELRDLNSRKSHPVPKVEMTPEESATFKATFKGDPSHLGQVRAHLEKMRKPVLVTSHAEDTPEYRVTGRCIECGGPFILGKYDGPDDVDHTTPTCLACGEKRDEQRKAFEADQRERWGRANS